LILHSLELAIHNAEAGWKTAPLIDSTGQLRFTFQGQKYALTTKIAGGRGFQSKPIKRFVDPTAACG
jgi:hypothetical protein